MYPRLHRIGLAISREWEKIIDFFCHEELASRQLKDDVGASQRKNFDAAFADPQLTLEDGALP
jgi:hypothetical protein